MRIIRFIIIIINIQFAVSYKIQKQSSAVKISQSSQ